MAVVVPALIGLVVLGLLLGFIGDVRSSSMRDSARSPIVAGEPGGSSWAVAMATGTAWPSSTESSTSDNGSGPNRDHSGKDRDRAHRHKHASNSPGTGFDATIQVCRSVERNRCVGRLETLSSGTQHFWLLVTFDNSQRGDRIGTQLEGPDGAIDTPDFTVRGGDGYAWAEVTRSLRPGAWTAVALRNGHQVATTRFAVD